MKPKLATAQSNGCPVPLQKVISGEHVWAFVDVVHPPAVNADEFRFIGIAARDMFAEVFDGAINSVFLIGYWHASKPVLLGESR